MPAKKKPNKGIPKKQKPEPTAAPSPAPAPAEPVDESGEQSTFTQIPNDADLMSRAAEISKTESSKLPKKGSAARTEYEEQKVEIQHFQAAQFAAQKSMQLSDMGMEKMDAVYSRSLKVLLDNGADLKFQYTDGEAVAVQDGFYQIYARLDPETLAKWGGLFSMFGLIGVMVAKIALVSTCRKIEVQIDEALDAQQKVKEAKESPLGDPVAADLN